jgi:hypothetical protein
MTYTSDISCLTDEMCVGKKNKYYNQWCIFHWNNYNYSPNYTISCHPEERISRVYPTCTTCWIFTDCCANSPEECCVKEFYTFPPTVSPTLSPYSKCMENGCTKEYTMNTCNIFEKIDDNIACKSGDNISCCSNKESECCVFKTVEVFGSMAAILVILLILINYFINSIKKTNIRQISPELQV